MHLHHAIDYIEICVGDLAAATRFYGQAFGWAFNEYGPAYAGIRKQDGEIGGLRQVEGYKGEGGGPLVILFSEDLQASLAAVEDAGGVVVEPPFEFPGGRRFHFSDPSGNVLGVWAEATSP
ncbi:VOC family protein [Pseudenhygromyxa sp. WMMC2535]|uniref:VOC family protein n=1 Tax=Pseudenhygromyxa sp. WMMC2535 TaxID=2712867 RepID=UPI00155200F0|nr:VOC family protein [Pseudenhygromyxa sp. WMMC2535]